MESKKDFLSELIDALIELRDNQKKLNIPVPPSPAVVLKTMNDVAKNHEFNVEDAEIAMAFRSASPSGVSVSEIQATESLKQKK